MESPLTLTHTILVLIYLSFHILVILLNFKKINWKIKKKKVISKPTPRQVLPLYLQLKGLLWHRSWWAQRRTARRNILSMKRTVPEYISHDFIYSVPGFTMYCSWETLGWLMPPSLPKNAGNDRNSYRTKAHHNLKLSSPNQNTSFCSRHKCSRYLYIIIWFWLRPKSRSRFLISTMRFYTKRKKGRSTQAQSYIQCRYTDFLAKTCSFFLFLLCLTIILRILCHQKVNKTN